MMSSQISYRSGNESGIVAMGSVKVTPVEDFDCLPVRINATVEANEPVLVVYLCVF